MNCNVQATTFRSSKEATGDEKKWCVEEKIFLGFTMCKTGKQIFKINIFFSTGK